MQNLVYKKELSLTEIINIGIFELQHYYSCLIYKNFISYIF